MSQPAIPLLDPLGRYAGKAVALGRALVETLTAQRDLYVQLASLARKQSDCIATGDSETLMSILAARSQLIDQLNPLDVRLQPHKDKWDATLAELTPPDRAAVTALLTQVRQLLADILQQDEADRQQLERQKQEVSAQITRTVTGTQLNRAYGVRTRPA